MSGSRKATYQGRGRNPYDVSGTGFEDANRERAVRAAAQRRPVFEAALKQATCSRRFDLLMKRLENPGMSNHELGQLYDPPMTKNAVASLLRRATQEVVA